MPKVSVIIPTYNAMHYLPATMRSLLNQTFDDFEAIVVNDGSSDETEQWVSQIENPKVKLISQQNKGLAGARNTGITHAQGDYIAFLDADDIWEQTKLAKQVTVLEENLEVGLVYTWVALIDEQGKFTGRIFKNNAEGNVWNQLTEHNIVECGSVAMVRRSCFKTVGVFDCNLRSFVEDWDMWLRIASRYPFKVVEEPLVYYRQISTSASRNWQAMEQSFQMVIEKAFDSAPSELLYLKKRSYGAASLCLAWKSLQSVSKDYKQANHFIQQALAYYPQLRFSKEYLRLSLAIALMRRFGPDGYQKIFITYPYSASAPNSDWTLNPHLSAAINQFLKGENMPQISVIIPAYNAERTIRKTIESIQEQTLQDFELIVINDGSKDRTLEIVQSIKDERLKIFSYSNSGVATARNRGISHARGEFIAFIDADDLWTPDKLELQLAALRKNPEVGVAYSWTCFMDVDEKGEALSFHPSRPYSFEGHVYEKLLVSDFIHSGSNTLIRRQAIDSVGEFDTTFPQCADWDYWLRLATRWSFVVVPKHQILYRRTPGAMSSKVEVMKEAALLAIEKAYQAAPPELQYLKSHTLKSFHIYCASLYLQHCTDISEISQAQQHLWSAIRIQPKTLLDQITLKLAIKFLLKRVFPPRVASYLFQWMRKPLAVDDPRLQS